MVWRVLTDFGTYPQWNPFVRGVIGVPESGSTLKIRLRLPEGGVRIFRATVERAIPAAELRWRTRLWVRGIFDGEHTFIIVPNGMAGTRFIQRERFSGFLAPLIFPMLARKILAGFDVMNAALKKVVEAKRR